MTVLFALRCHKEFLNWRYTSTVSTIYIINPADKTRWSYVTPNRRTTTVFLETNPRDSFIVCFSLDDISMLSIYLLSHFAKKTFVLPFLWRKS